MRVQKSGFGKKELVIELVGRNNVNGLVVGNGEFLPRPLTVLRARVHVGPALHMFERGQHQVVARCRHCLREFLCRRRKHHLRLEVRRVLRGRVIINGENGTLLIAG